MNWRAWLGLLGFLAMTDSAFAASQTAELVELDQDGHEIHGIVANPVLTMDGKKFSLAEFRGESQFLLTRTYKTPCRTTVYEAREKVANGRTLVLEDHEGRVCMDYRKYQWEVTIKQGRLKRELYGNPKDDDIKALAHEDCQKIASDTMCIMLFMPATCTASTADDLKTTLRPPLVAKGGNPCGAMVNLKVQACERGIAADRLTDRDVSCVPDDGWVTLGR